jgi:hypothetical protein
MAPSFEWTVEVMRGLPRERGSRYEGISSASWASSGAGVIAQENRSTDSTPITINPDLT